LVAGILATFAVDPDAALTVADIAMPAYGVELRQVTKAHRVAVLRAMRRVREIEPRFGLMDGQGPEGQTIVYDRTRVLSYGLARLKRDWLERYQWRTSRCRGDRPSKEAELRAQIAPGGDHHQHVTPDGAWWKHCLIPQAEIAGDHETAALLREQEERKHAAFMAAGRKMFAGFGIGYRAPAPVKPDKPDPAWDDDPAWQALWAAAKGRRQKRDLVRRRVRAAGGIVRRWHLEMPSVLFRDGRARVWLGPWSSQTGFSRGVDWNQRLTVSSVVAASQRKHQPPDALPGEVAA
jgi:hypothetical protein